MMNSRVVFLDFDGVIASSDTYSLYTKEDPFAVLDSKRVSLVDEICKRGEASVVLCTSWRHSIPLDFLREKLKDLGLSAEIVGVTPHKLSSWKTEEIKMYLDEHPEIKHYVILEDDFIHDEELAKHWVSLSFHTALQERHVEEALIKLQLSRV